MATHIGLSQNFHITVYLALQVMRFRLWLASSYVDIDEMGVSLMVVLGVLHRDSKYQDVKRIDFPVSNGLIERKNNP